MEGGVNYWIDWICVIVILLLFSLNKDALLVAPSLFHWSFAPIDFYFMKANIIICQLVPSAVCPSDC